MKFEQYLKAQIERDFLDKKIKSYNQTLVVERISIEFGVDPCLEVYFWGSGAMISTCPWGDMPEIIESGFDTLPDDYETN